MMTPNSPHPYRETSSAALARLDIHHGVARLLLDADPELPTLYRLASDEARLEVETDGLAVHVHSRISWTEWLEEVLGGRDGGARITLDGARPWRIAIRGGASEVTVDLARLARLDALEIRGGASEVAVALPRPTGTVALAISGGASELALRRPRGVPLRLSVRGGVSDLTLDESHFEAIGGHTILHTEGWAAATDRYELSISGGASGLAVTPAEGEA